MAVEGSIRGKSVDVLPVPWHLRGRSLAVIQGEHGAPVRCSPLRFIRFRGAQSNGGRGTVGQEVTGARSSSADEGATVPSLSTRGGAARREWKESRSSSLHAANLFFPQPLPAILLTFRPTAEKLVAKPKIEAVSRCAAPTPYRCRDLIPSQGWK